MVGGLRRVALSILLTLLAMGSLWAEISSSVELDINNNILIDPSKGDVEVHYLAAGSATLNLNSTGNRNVRSYLSLSAGFLDNDLLLSIDKAYIRSRIDPFRLTLGKTRLSWGEGAVFNAADLVMGGTDLNVDLSSDEFRSSSKWLSAVYLPLGRFAFLEAVVLPPDPEQYFTDYETNSATAVPPAFEDSSAGLRSVFTLESLGDIKLESGYLYDGEENSHSPYLSLQGGSGVNWHVSSSWEINQARLNSGNLDDGVRVSGGLYGVKKLGERLSLNLRGEALYNFGGLTSEFNGTALKPYSLYAFAETGLSIDQLVSTYIRAIVSPLDSSALLLAGASFNLYQGTSFYASASFRAGDSNDNFRNPGIGSYSATLGMKFVY